MPEFGGLFPDVPFVVVGTRGEIALLGTAAFLVGAYPDYNALVGVLIHIRLVVPGSVVHPVTNPIARESVSQSFAFQVFAAGQPVDSTLGISHLLRERVAVLPVDHIEFPFASQPVAVCDHFRYFKMSVYMHHRKRDMSEKRLTGEP